MRALVVDDNDSVRETVCELLQHFGLATTAAASYEEAKSCLAAGGRYDVLLSDFLLRGKHTGLDVVAEAIASKTSCVIMSAAIDRQAAVEAHGIRFLAKPFRAAALLAAVGLNPAELVTYCGHQRL